MPIYAFKCEKCGFEREELRKLGDTTTPKCVYCNVVMERLIVPITAILKGPGWARGDWRKLRERSIQQGNKFFNRHDDLKQTSEQAINEKPTN